MTCADKTDCKSCAEMEGCGWCAAEKKCVKQTRAGLPEGNVCAEKGFVKFATSCEAPTKSLPSQTVGGMGMSETEKAYQAMIKARETVDAPIEGGMDVTGLSPDELLQGQAPEKPVVPSSVSDKYVISPGNVRPVGAAAPSFPSGGGLQGIMGGPFENYIQMLVRSELASQGVPMNEPFTAQAPSTAIGNATTYLKNSFTGLFSK